MSHYLQCFTCLGGCVRCLPSTVLKPRGCPPSFPALKNYLESKRYRLSGEAIMMHTWVTNIVRNPGREEHLKSQTYKYIKAGSSSSSSNHRCSIEKTDVSKRNTLVVKNMFDETCPKKNQCQSMPLCPSFPQCPTP